MKNLSWKAVPWGVIQVIHFFLRNYRVPFVQQKAQVHEESTTQQLQRKQINNVSDTPKKPVESGRFATGVWGSLKHRASEYSTTPEEIT